MTEAETKELHRAIADRFERGWEHRRIVGWSHKGVVDGEFRRWYDYRHPVHFNRLQALLGIETFLITFSSSRQDWGAKMLRYKDGEYLGSIEVEDEFGRTPGQAIVACVVELLEVTK